MQLSFTPAAIAKLMIVPFSAGYITPTAKAVVLRNMLRSRNLLCATIGVVYHILHDPLVCLFHSVHGNNKTTHMDHIAESSPKAEEATDWEGAIHGAHPSSCPTQVELDCGSSTMEGQVLQTQLSEN